MSFWKNLNATKLKAPGKPGLQKRPDITKAGKRKGSMSLAPPPHIALAANKSFETKETDLDSMGMYIPLYDNRKRKQQALKEQLGDITSRLHQTLFDYDTLNDYEKEVRRRDSVLKDTRNKLRHMEGGEMKDTIESMIGQYNVEVSENTIGALNERDDLLYQLADWFSADHSELNELDVSMGKEEENEMEQSMNSTMANFEKLKRVQKQINSGSLDTKKLFKLEQEKRKLEMNMINNVKVMKTISIQAMPVGDEAPPWKHAADQIVNMLNQVRMEGNEELMGLSQHLKELMKNLGEQQKQIKSLKGDLKREKKVAEQLSDENTNLTLNVSELQEKIVQQEEELERAKKALERKLSLEPQATGNVAALLAPPELIVKKSNMMVKDLKEAVHQPSSLSIKTERSDKGSEAGSKIKITLSGIISEFLQDDVPVHETSSDPSLLRSCIRDQREALQLLSQEIKKLKDTVADLEDTLKQQSGQVVNLQDENDDLRDKVGDYELELEKFSSKGLEIKASSVSLMCPKCKGRTQSSTLSAADSVGSCKDEDVNKWMQKAKFYQKCLADTEMKLSNAYKEISDLRSQMVFEPEKRPSVPPPTPTAKDDVVIEEEPEEEQVKSRLNKRRPVKKPQPKKKPVKLPPIKKSMTSNLTMEEELPQDLDMPDATSDREEKLWKLGDLQGRMTQLMNEILEFAKQVANMIYQDNSDAEKGARFTAMQTFDFSKNDSVKSKQDPKVTEGRQKRSQAFFLGQKSIGCLKEVYELLSGSLSLQHDDYELIYRAFKNHQYQRAIRQAVMAGKMPLSALQYAKDGKGGNLTDNRVARSALAYSLKQQQTHMTGTGVWNRMDTGLWKTASSTSVASDLSEGHKSALNNAVMVLGIHRSKSEVDVHSVHSDVSHASSQPREHSQILLTSNASDILRERRTAGLNREETKIPTTTVPKKGLIKLTALNYEIQDPGYYEKQREDEDDNWVRKKPLGHIADTHKHLVKKTMIEHMKEGSRMLAEEEKLHRDQEEIEKQLGEYTIGDLHKNITEMTEMSKKKSEERLKALTTGKPMNTPPQRKQRIQPVERSVTLPSIKDFTFG